MNRLLKLASLLLLISSLITTKTFGQNPHCGTDDYLREAIINDPKLTQRLHEDDLHYETFLKKFRQKAEKNSELGLKTKYTIPCVVHVVHDGNPNTPDSITLDQIESQFQALFETYRRVPGTMGFGAGTDMQIEFSLATKDPNGNPTKGVTYHADTALADLDRSKEDNVLKQLAVWDRKKYLNIWLVNNISSIDISQGILGYAQFPTMTAETDGIVIRSFVFGTRGTVGTLPNIAEYKFGRTATHECGHWLNLFHTFHEGCGNSRCTQTGDRVCDTPPADKETFGFGESRKNTCSLDIPDLPNNPRNYMDYLNDEGLNFFTEGQKVRAFATLEDERYPQRNLLWQDNNLRATGSGPYKKPKADFWADNLNPCIGTPITFQDYSAGSPNEWLWQFDGGTPATSTEASPIVQYNRTGRFRVRLIVKNASGFADTIEKSNFITVRSVKVDQLPFTENFSGSFPPQNWLVNNPDAENKRLTKTWQVLRGTAFIAGFRYSDYGQQDDLWTPPMDISQLASPTLTYRWAYAPFQDNTNRNYVFGDTFEILASLDCGKTWQRVFRKSAEKLSTTGGAIRESMDFPFDEQWARETVCLDPVKGQSNVQLSFRFTSGYGNNFFLDNVWIGDSTNRNCAVSRPEDIVSSQWVIYPNPTDNQTHLQVNLSQPVSLYISIQNALGQTVYQQQTSKLSAGKQDISLALPMTPGVYAIMVNDGQRIQSFKVIKQ